MGIITETAQAFFDACETGKGWDVCKQYCTADASFAAQAEPLADVTTLAGYCDWMKALFRPIPDGHYDLKSFATDLARNNVSATQCSTAPIPAPVGRRPRAGRWPPTMST